MPRSKRRFRPPGKELEYRVSEELTALGIDHDHFTEGSPEDATHKIDFRLFRGIPGEDPMDFQITLIQGAQDKIRSFVAAALTNLKNRGVRVYMEISASKALWWKVQDGRTIMARMVAKAMKNILYRFGSFESGNLLGVRLKISKRSRFLDLTRFSLLHAVGTRWLVNLVGWIERRRAKEAIARRLAHRVVEQSWRIFSQPLGGLGGILERVHPPPRPAFAGNRNRFVPRRCP